MELSRPQHQTGLEQPSLRNPSTTWLTHVLSAATVRLPPPQTTQHLFPVASPSQTPCCHMCRAPLLLLLQPPTHQAAPDKARLHPPPRLTPPARPPPALPQHNHLALSFIRNQVGPQQANAL
uniref:Uncharacterized protein n=1 Tax=Knipowitschia caucasica TaxID=637954 RepID=A0AAV2IWX7_KNICA